MNQAPHSLNLSEVLSRLAEKDSAWARDLVSDLTKLQTFRSSDARIDLLIDALSKVNPASKEAVAYWDEHSHTASIFLHLVIKALCENASSGAVDLLERKLLDASMDDYTKQIWLQQAVLPNRNRIGLLQGARRWVDEARLSEALRSMLISVLFDYQPDVWFAPDAMQHPPGLKNTSTEALAVLVEIAGVVLDRSDIPQGQRQVVERALTGINAELFSR